MVALPSVEPVTVDEFKAWSRDPSSTEDAVISVIIMGVRETAEKYLNRALITQTVDQFLDSFPDSEIELERTPVQSITSVKYYDDAGILQTLDPANYTLDNATVPGWLLPAVNAQWPSTYPQANAVIIRYTCGYGSSGASCPGDVMLWMRMVGNYCFENRASVVMDGKAVEIPNRFIDRLMDGERLWVVG